MAEDHNSYIAEAAVDLRPLLKHVRALLAEALPGAEEIIAYKMPGFRIAGSIVAGYAGFSRNCGLYVAPGAIAACVDEIALAGLKATKTGVTFSPAKPIPDELVRKLALASERVSASEG